MKRSTFLKLKLREARFITRALMRTDHPVLAHIIPMRRCNLACTYCNEFDKTSDPVPLEAMKSRLDALARLGTSVITISGGEPLMHPELDEIIRHIRRRGMIAGLITNFISSGTVDPIAAPYSIISLAIGIAAGIGGYYGWHKTWPGRIALYVLIVLVASIGSTPLNVNLYAGQSGVPLGDAIYFFRITITS